MLGCNRSGDGNDSDDTELQPPDAPSDLTVAGGKKYQAALYWTDNSDNEDGFVVERRAGEKGWQEIADIPANVPNYTDTTLECDGITYEYRVKAYNDAGESGYTNVAGATTLDCWTIEWIDTVRVPDQPSIALDSNNKAHISYLACLAFDYWNDWWCISKVHVSYQASHFAGYADLKYATNAEVE